MSNLLQTNNKNDRNDKIKNLQTSSIKNVEESSSNFDLSSEDLSKKVVQIGTTFHLESAEQPTILMSGLVYKRASGIIHNWKKRFQVLYSNKELAYFKKGSSKPIKNLSLAGASFCFTDEVKSKPKTIKIMLVSDEKQQLFYFHNENVSEILRWKEALISAGVFYVNVISAQKDDLRNVKVSEWSSELVVRFLHEIIIPQIPVKERLYKKFNLSQDLTIDKLKSVEDFSIKRENFFEKTFGEYYGQVFLTYGINGDILLNDLNEELMYTMGIMEPLHRQYLMRYINHLKIHRYFKSIETLYFTMKVESFLVPEFMAEKYQLLIHSLIDQKLIFSTYLSEDPASITQIIQQLDDSVIPNETKIYQPIKSKEIGIIFLEETNWCEANDFFHPVILKQNTRPFPINEESIGRVGEIHAALVVCGWILDWNQSSIIIPRRICQGIVGRVFYSAVYKIESLNQERTLTKVLNVVAKTVSHYNANFQFHQERRNSYHFITEILESIDLPLSKLKKEQDLVNMLEEIQIHGESEPKRIIYKENSCTESKIESFNTFNQLNQYTISLLQKENELSSSNNKANENSKDEIQYKSVISYLKTLSRVFWIRHLNNKKLFLDCNEITGKDLLATYSRS